MPVVAGPKARRLAAKREILYVVLREGFPDGRREGGGGHRLDASAPSVWTRRRRPLSALAPLQGSDVPSLAGAAARGSRLDSSVQRSPGAVLSV